MSEMTRCNYCDWQSMKRRGHRIATPEERVKLDKGVHKMFRSGVVVVDQKGKFVAWFMELPDHCCC